MSEIDSAVAISEVPFAAIEHLRRAAAADRVRIADRANTRWFAAACDGVIVGIIGLHRMGGSRALLHGAWVRRGWPAEQFNPPVHN